MKPLDNGDLHHIRFKKIAKNADIANANINEEDKIKTMITQSSQEYDPSKYLKRGIMKGPVPLSYVCQRCRNPGHHWINNCPSNNRNVKHSTGIPRSFMVPVAGPEHKGALLTSKGDYAVPYIAYQAYKEVKKEKPPFAPQDESIAEPKTQISEELLCMICKDLLEDAVTISCCANSFCDNCVRQALLESENHECPECHKTEVSPDTLIPNLSLRKLVSKKNRYKHKPNTEEKPASVKWEIPSTLELKIEINSADINDESSQPPVSPKSGLNEESIDDRECFGKIPVYITNRFNNYKGYHIIESADEPSSKKKKVKTVTMHEKQHHHHHHHKNTESKNRKKSPVVIGIDKQNEISKNLIKVEAQTDRVVESKSSSETAKIVKNLEKVKDRNKHETEEHNQVENEENINSGDKVEENARTTDHHHHQRRDCRKSYTCAEKIKKFHRRDYRKRYMCVENIKKYYGREKAPRKHSTKSKNVKKDFHPDLKFECDYDAFRDEDKENTA